MTAKWWPLLELEAMGQLHLFAPAPYTLVRLERGQCLPSAAVKLHLALLHLQLERDALLELMQASGLYLHRL